MGLEKVNSYKIITYSGTDPALKPYLPMIYSSFLKTLRFGNDWFKLIDSNIYYFTYKQVIDLLLTRRALICVRLACLSDDLDTCLGWSIIEPDTLHYVYVKKDFREQGIAKELLNDFCVVTHLTKLGQKIRALKKPDSIFNPFLT